MWMIQLLCGVGLYADWRAIKAQLNSPAVSRMNYDSYIRDGRLCWTLTSNGYKYLTWNFVKFWAKSIGSKQAILILCADQPSYLFFQREGVPCKMAPTRLPDFGPGVVQFDTKNFHTLNLLKLQCLHEFAKDEKVRECVYLDGDIVIYKDFLADIGQRLQEHPLWFQCDEGIGCKGQDTCGNLCTGLIAFRHGTDPHLFLVNDRALWEKGGNMDQPYINQRINDLAAVAKALPQELYPNGRRLGTERPDALLQHYNHLVGNQKAAMMKRRGDWLIPQI